MSLHRPLFLAAWVLPLSLIACGSSDSEGDDDDVVPTGTHYGYVVSKAAVIPPSGQTPASLGLDLGSSSGVKLDGKVDNRLGQALSALTAFFNVQNTVDTAVSHGGIILLVDVQTEDFKNTSAAGLSVKFGANANPAPCTDANDTACGRHLGGNAMFSIAADSPNDAQLNGKIVNGTFTSNPGNVTLQLAIGSSTAPIELSLIHARAKASSISATGVASITVGGLLTQADLTAKVGPAIQASVAGILAADCTGSGPPECGCKANSQGAQVISILDGDLTGTARDCKVSVEELLGYPVVAALLEPDSCSKDSCTEADSLSIGVKVEAVKATF